MTEIPATFFDGRTSQPRPVTLRWHAFDGVLEVTGEGVAQRHARRDVAVESRLGRGPRFIRFADGGRCEVASDPAIDEVIATWAPDRAGTLLHRFETNWVLVVVASVFLLAGGWAAIHFGLPWAARRIAFALPAGVTRQLGDQTLAALDKTMLDPSKLDAERQRALQAEFSGFLAKTGDTTPYRIEFRSAREMGANAFALPSGVIVITDELVKLTEDDREIVGVLAHECGHIQHRHALRGVLQNSAVFVVIALITGDVSSATAFGGALPAYLLQSRFSREFEREADAYAVEKMRAASIDTAVLARMLERLAETHGEKNSKVLGYLGTHPPTPERIQAITGKR
ncbi:MAG TPA: M48 family metallopeptidase [Opitutaceae bacterium]|nr:M48 family metallopeptidase [Opitutaceae bacterium]